MAFVGLLSGGGHAVIKQNSSQENTILAKTGETIDDRTLQSLGFAKSVVINNNGDVIFFALFFADFAGTLGYFTPDDYLIGNGDIIDGKTVAAVTTASINNHVGLTGAQFTDNSLALIKFSILSDVDGDGVDGIIDNCPETANPSQEDSNENGEGDACDAETLRIAELESDLTDAEDARDAALADLTNLFDNNSCIPKAKNILEVFACINTLITDLGQALTDLDAANAKILELESVDTFPINFVQPILNAVNDLDIDDASLTRTLERSLSTAERADGVACKGVASFLDDITQLESGGILTDTEVQTLRDSAEALKTSCGLP